MLHPDIVNKARLVEVNDDLTGYLKEIAIRMFPNIDFSEVNFCFSDKSPNAFFARKNQGYEAALCVDKNLVEMCDNEDQLAFIIGHEVTHKLVGKNNSKLIEASSDVNSIEVMYRAGYDIKQANVIMNKLANNGNRDSKGLVDDIIRSLDVHPDDFTRDFILRTVESDYSTNRGVKLSELRTTPLKHKKQISELKYQSYIRNVFDNSNFYNKNTSFKERMEVFSSAYYIYSKLSDEEKSKDSNDSADILKAFGYMLKNHKLDVFSKDAKSFIKEVYKKIPDDFKLGDADVMMMEHLLKINTFKANEFLSVPVIRKIASNLVSASENIQIFEDETFIKNLLVLEKIEFKNFDTSKIKVGEQLPNNKKLLRLLGIKSNLMEREDRIELDEDRVFFVNNKKEVEAVAKGRVEIIKTAHNVLSDKYAYSIKHRLVHLYNDYELLKNGHNIGYDKLNKLVKLFSGKQNSGKILADINDVSFTFDQKDFFNKIFSNNITWEEHNSEIDSWDGKKYFDFEKHYGKDFLSLYYGDKAEEIQKYDVDKMKTLFQYAQKEGELSVFTEAQKDELFGMTGSVDYDAEADKLINQFRWNYNESIKNEIDAFLDNTSKDYKYKVPQKMSDILALQDKKIPSRVLQLEYLRILKKQKEEKLDLFDIENFPEHTFNFYDRGYAPDEIIDYVDQILDKEDKSPDLDKRILNYFNLINGGFLKKEYKVKEEKISGFWDDIKKIENPQIRKQYLEIFMISHNRITFAPKLREKFFDEWSDIVANDLGMDNKSEDFYRKLMEQKSNVSDYKLFLPKKYDSSDYGAWGSRIAYADQIALLRKVSDKCLTQEKSSIGLAKDFKLNEKQVMDSTYMGAFTEVITANAFADKDLNRYLVKYLSEEEDEELNKKIAERLKEKAREGVNNITSDVYNKNFEREISVFHKNFWNLPFEQRAIAMKYIMETADKDWQNNFKTVMDIVLPEKHKYKKITLDILDSYLTNIEKSDAEVLVPAMLVAEIKKEGDDEISLGAILSKFLSSQGPMQVKLGQAIDSYPNLPKELKSDEIKALKTDMNIPDRATMFRRLKALMPKSEYEKLVHVGKVLGGGSYFISVAVEKENKEKSVIGYLNKYARERAEKGGVELVNTLSSIQEKGYSDTICVPLKRMIKQAQKMNKIETNNKAGLEQSIISEKTYDGLSISSGGLTMDFQVARWKSIAPDYKEMELCEGLDFNKLPEDTKEDKYYKKHIAKIYLTAEIINIMEGGYLDHDRHGGQIKVDKKNDKIHIFDNGAMSLVPPSKEEKELLGQILSKVYKKALIGQSPEKNIEKEILSLTTKDNDAPDHIVEVQKAILALGDFMSKLSTRDQISAMITAFKSCNVDPSIEKGFMNGAPRTRGELLKAINILGSMGNTGKVERKEIKREVINVQEFTIDDIIKGKTQEELSEISVLDIFENDTNRNNKVMDINQNGNILKDKRVFEKVGIISRA